MKMEEIVKQDASNKTETTFFYIPKVQGDHRRQENRWEDRFEILSMRNVLQPTNLELEVETLLFNNGVQ
jgi:hypothetical protein